MWNRERDTIYRKRKKEKEEKKGKGKQKEEESTTERFYGTEEGRTRAARFV